MLYRFCLHFSTERGRMSEDEWYKRWRKMMPFGPWSFPDIDEMMKEMEREFMSFKDLNKDVPKELVREKKYPDGSVKREIGPIVYGYSLTIGPDGKPIVREFGNVKRGPGAPWKALTDKREPLVDVVDSDKDVRVIAELPGAKKEEVEITIDGRTLTISVDNPERKYHKELELPDSVKVKSAKSTFNNGILEVAFEKESGKGGGVRLKIE
jgi:HSP20 family protein